MFVTSLLTITALSIFSLITIVFFLKAKTPKVRIVTSILLGLVFAFLAYNFVPKNDYDLVRHQEVARSMSNVESPDDFHKKVKENDFEILPQMYSFAIAKTGNYNLMPAIIAFIGYGLLFYMLADFRDKVRLSDLQFILLSLVVIFGQHILFYFSGLYNYFAINLFAFAFYLDAVKKKKIMPILLYTIAFLTHNSLLLPIAALVLFKIKRGKFSNRFVLLLLLSLVLFGFVLDSIVAMMNIEFLNDIKRTFDGYIVNNNKWFGLYDGFYLFMSITKIAVSLFACWVDRDNEDTKQSRAFTLLLAVIVIALSFSSIAITRFSSLVLFIAMPAIMSAMKRKEIGAQVMILSVGILAIVYTIYSLQTILPMINFG